VNGERPRHAELDQRRTSSRRATAWSPKKISRCANSILIGLVEYSEYRAKTDRPEVLEAHLSCSSLHRYWIVNHGGAVGFIQNCLGI
jgi:hypothetical protein